MVNNNKRNIDFGKILLIAFCALLVILIFKTFLIPAVLGMTSGLLRLVDMYKLLEMPYLFFGTALFIFITWYVFSILCNLTYRLFKFVMTTSIYKEEKENDSEGEIREGAYCTQCGKHIKKEEWKHKDGHIEKYFFGLLERDIWESYSCSDKCWKKFVKDKYKDETGKNLNTSKGKNK